MIDRRSQQRNLCSDIIELSWKDDDGWPHRTKAILEDISTLGACVQIEANLPVGSEVALRLNEAGFPAKVRYCTLINGSYFVGIEFAEGCGWMPGVSDPQHLLQLPPIRSAQATLKSGNQLFSLVHEPHTFK
jgi:hypothetical protein